MKPRPIRIEGDVAYVPLTKGYEAVIDAADAPHVAGKNWTAVEDRKSDGTVNGVYARRSVIVGGMKTVEYLHSVIMPLESGMIPDHRDRDPLNNRRANLRPATRAENNRNCARSISNTSGVKGVSWHKQRGKWQAQIVVDRKHLSLGLYVRLEDAATAYAEASAKYHGEFGRTA